MGMPGPTIEAFVEVELEGVEGLGFRASETLNPSSKIVVCFRQPVKGPLLVWSWGSGFTALYEKKGSCVQGDGLGWTWWILKSRAWKADRGEEGSEKNEGSPV